MFRSRERARPNLFRVVLNGGLDARSENELRDALQLSDGVPIVPCDATDKESVKTVLLALLYSVLDEIEQTAAHA